MRRSGKSLTEYARKKLGEIHALSARYNGKGGAHADKLLGLMRKHVEEIEQLHAAGDPHYAVETGDLLVLCHEILLEGREDADLVMEKCYRRYEEKLRELLSEDLEGKRE